MIREVLAHIAANYAEARTGPLRGAPVAHYLRHTAPEAVADALAQPGFIVEGSPGQGNWATIPWISIFDPAVTDSATRGYYVVYLFSADLSHVTLSLNQGTTAVRDEFKNGAIPELHRRAALMRARVPEFETTFNSHEIDLAANGYLPSGYEAGHAFGTTYQTADLPYEELLTRDLREMCALYVRLTKRGGLDYLDESGAEEIAAEKEELEERRKYSLHRKIDRNPKASKKAKAIHGYVCQACDFDFEAFYGPIGKEYIEAHHLLPLAELPEDQPVSINPETDFAVLCANCHRMIHRKDAPRAITEFRTIVRR